MSEKPRLKLTDIMRQADLKNKDFYASLEPDLKKDLTPPLVAMHMMSFTQNSSAYKDYYIMMVNGFVNLDFWALSKHPELQWKLMAMTGVGVSVNHPWVPMAKRKKVSKLGEFMLRWYPSANDMELDIILSGMDRDGFEQFVKDTGATDEELKDLIKQYDAEKGTSAPKKERTSKKRAN